VKVIIPLAGKGTRLRPHTHTVPKPMLKVAGKPVMDYVMDDVKKLGTVTEVIYITGHLKEAVEQHARTVHAALPATFIEQKVQDGTAGAIALAKAYVQEPVLIIFVDTIFDTDLSVISSTDADGIIWVKEVEDYQRFGVVVTDADGFMTKIIEKPNTPVSKRANIGLYYIKNWKLLAEGIAYTLQQPSHKGEYYLTDAFQYMIDHGAKIKVADVQGWYDAGKLDTLLETNQAMLETRNLARVPDGFSGATIIPPVYIEDGVTAHGATIGPNVSIGAGTSVTDSSISNSVLGDKCVITGSKIRDSMIGNAVVLTNVTGSMSLGDHSEFVAG
jgi:glucose-1-phosphate thymidylyltransferase